MSSWEYKKLAKNPELLSKMEQQIKSILQKHSGKELSSSEISGFIHIPEVIDGLRYTIETPNPQWNIKAVVGAVAEEMSRQGQIKKGDYRVDPVTGIKEETWYL